MVGAAGRATQSVEVLPQSLEQHFECHLLPASQMTRDWLWDIRKQQSLIWPSPADLKLFFQLLLA